MEKTLTDNTIISQSGLGSNYNEGVFRILKAQEVEPHPQKF